MDERIEEKSRFVHGNKFDSKTLASALPEIAQELRDGKVDADTVVSNLLQCTLWYLPKKYDPDDKEDSFTYLYVTLCCEVFLSCEDLRDTEIPSFIPRVRNNIFLKIIMRESEMRSRGLFVTCVRNLLQAFKETLDCWKTRIQASTGLPLEDTCQKLYHMTNDQFMDLVVRKLSVEYDTSQLLNEAYGQSLVNKTRYIAAAAKGVAEGTDRIESTCWECGTFQATLCSQCHVACYCSIECQKKSWREGHKQVCKKMRLLYAPFKNDFELIDKAAASSTEVMPKTNPFLDYHLLATMWKTEIMEEEVTPTNVFKRFGCPEPSIAIFHRSLQTIVQKSHWLFDGDQEQARDDPIVPSECGPFYDAAFYLCFDLSALENFPQDFRSNLLKPMRDDLKIGRSETRLTAKRFVRLYETTDNSFEPLNKEIDSGGARLECLARVLKLFKKKFNEN